MYWLLLSWVCDGYCCLFFQGVSSLRIKRIAEVEILERSTKKMGWEQIFNILFDTDFFISELFIKAYHIRLLDFKFIADYITGYLQTNFVIQVLYSFILVTHHFSLSYFFPDIISFLFLLYLQFRGVRKYRDTEISQYFISW